MLTEPDAFNSRLVKIATDKIRSEQQSATRTIQSLSSSIHAREMELSRKRQELKDKEALEARQNDTREEVANLEKQAKVSHFVSQKPSRGFAHLESSCRNSTNDSPIL